MKILETTVFQGPNIFAGHPVIRFSVDLSAVREWSPRRLGPAFADGLIGFLPGLAGHADGDGRAGGFVASLGERGGATLADVLAHAVIELQGLTGADVTYCEALPGAAHDAYDVVYAYKEAFVGLRAGGLALALIRSLLPEEVRDGDAAEHDLGARPVGVDVVAGADPDIAEPERLLGRHPAIGGGDVGGGGELDVAGIAGDDLHRDSGPLGDGGIVGMGAGAKGRRLAVGVEDGCEGKALGRLRPPQAGSVDRIDDDAIGTTFEAVGHGQRRDRAGVAG